MRPGSPSTVWACSTVVSAKFLAFCSNRRRSSASLGWLSLRARRKSAPLSDFPGDLALAAHGVDRLGRALEVERVQKLRDGGDFVRLLRCLDLTENQTALDRVGGKSVDGRFALGLLEGAARRLTVDRHDLAGSADEARSVQPPFNRLQSLSRRMDIYNCVLLFFMRII